MVTKAPRRRLHPARRKAEIIASASVLFERTPYDQLGVEDIATGCDVSLGLIYHHFGTKRNLYVACLERRLEDFIGAIRDPGPGVPLEQRLDTAIASYLDFVETYPRSYAAVLRGGIGADAAVHSLVESARERFAAKIFGGLGITDPPAEFALAVWGWMGLVEAACTRWLERGDVDRDRVHRLLVESAFATFTAGVASPG